MHLKECALTYVSTTLQPSLANSRVIKRPILWNAPWRSMFDDMMIRLFANQTVFATEKQQVISYDVVSIERYAYL